MHTVLRLLPLFLILLFASLFRLWNLGNIPYGLADDEMRIIYSAYTLWQTGHDVAGSFLPLSIDIHSSFSPVYMYATAPFVGLFGLSSFVGRLPFALISIATVFLLYLLVKEVSKNKWVALSSSFVLAISPWGIHLGRSALDANFALFFYLLSIYIFITRVSKGGIVWSVPILLLAFYSYHATKIFFVFLIPLLIIFYWKTLKQRKKELVFFILGCVAIIGSYFVLNYVSPIEREQVLLWNNATKASEVVNKERTYSTAPAIVQQIFNNKILYFARIFREQYFTAFSPEFLFLYGDPGSGKLHLSLLTRGQMYVIEALFFILGIYFVIRYRQARIFIALLLIAPLPSAFGDHRTYFNRSVMLLPILAVFTGYGLYFFFTALKKKNTWVLYATSIVVVMWYLFLVVSFTYQYFYRYPLTGSEGSMRSSRELAEYIGNNRQNFEKVYVYGADDTHILQYALFNNIDPRIIQAQWGKAYPKNIDNVSFSTDCIEDIPSFLQENPHTIYIAFVGDKDCTSNATPSATINDKGDMIRQIWKIYY